jgi:clan AA aspartic protease, TIGR02281 family
VFMLDTGATGVALSESLARRLGVTGRGSGQVSTANGVTQAQLAQLDALAFGGWTFEDVPAFIMPQMDDEVLLGMQVLRHFRWHQEAGVFRLQPPE